jgi:CheY-like chemotaxis protein
VSVHEVEEEKWEETIFRAALSRFRIAKGEGGNFVCSQSQLEEKEQKGKILVVDMDRANQEILKTSLENLKYDVVLANDGLEAFALAEKELPDLIVSEIMLPKIDGFVLCEKLRQNSVMQDISFVILSDLKNEDSVKRALKLGVEHYFKKPYILYELLGIIQMKVKGEILDGNQF